MIETGDGQGVAFRVHDIGLDIAAGTAALAGGDGNRQDNRLQIGASSGGCQGEGVALGGGAFTVGGNDLQHQVGRIGGHHHARRRAEGTAIIGGRGITVVSAEDQPGRQVGDAGGGRVMVADFRAGGTNSLGAAGRVGDDLAFRVGEGTGRDGMAEAGALLGLQVREGQGLDGGIVVADYREARGLREGGRGVSVAVDHAHGKCRLNQRLAAIQGIDGRVMVVRLVENGELAIIIDAKGIC